MFRIQPPERNWSHCPATLDPCYPTLDKVSGVHSGGKQGITDLRYRFKYSSFKGNFHIIFLMYCHNREGFSCRTLSLEDNENRENKISDLS